MKEILICTLIAFLLSFILVAIEIPLLKKIGAGQNILSYVKEHEKKGGTPTMGGLAFVFAACVVSLTSAAIHGADKSYFVLLAIGLGYMLVGFLDDLMKKLRGKNLGLRAYQKILFQIAVAVLASVYCCLNGLTALKIPYTNLSFDIGWGMLPLGVVVFVATTNGVNLTDGLDGLAGSICAFFFIFLGLLLMLQGENEDIVTLSFCLTGALAAYLVFNNYRASIFMGDTGSMFLGGIVCALGVGCGVEFLMVLAAMVYILEALSVVIQSTVFKITKRIYHTKEGKRLFKMTPIHHHFELLHWSEIKIDAVFSTVAALFGAFAVVLAYGMFVR